MGIGASRKCVDFGNQFFHAAEGSGADGLLRDAAEPDFQLVEPRSVGRREVHVEAGPRRQPALHPRMFVRRVIVHDDIRVQLAWHVLLDLPQKIEILLMLVTLPAFCHHFALRRVRRRKQRRSAMASVVVRHALDVTESQRQHRLGAFERLNLALFIHAQYYGALRRTQVRPYHIRYLLHKRRKLRIRFETCAKKRNVTL